MRNMVTMSRLGRFGRFANGCYQVASSIGIARRNGFDFAFPLWQNHNGRDFEPELDIDVYKHFVNQLPIYDGPPLPQLGIPFGYQDVNLTQSTDLEGHFQSERYFSHCIDEARWYMRMIGESPMGDKTTLHVRLGDYGHQASPQHPDGNPYHPRMNLSYYEPAMAQFGSSQKFLVFSDDIEECKKMFAGRPNVEYSEGRDYMEDFKLMKTCRHFIIANSSYSAFAALLGEAPDKQVVAPDPWFGGPYTGRLSAEDIYSPGWQIVNYETGEARVKA